MSSPSFTSDRYHLSERLGRGGMADVYRARDQLLGRDVAIKLLRDTSEDATDRRRLVSEATTLAALSHPGLVTVLDAGFTDDHPYLVMELVDGPSLDAASGGRQVASYDVARLGLQVAEALAYAHGQGVVHRDVKPANILLGKGGRVRLADFGIARLIGDTVRHTVTGHAIGTAAYLAPEQVTGGDLTGAMDVYSLGLVLLESLTGVRAYPGPPTEAALARLHRPPDIPADLPQAWRDLVTSMTHLDPLARPTAAQVAQTLTAFPTAPPPRTASEQATAVLPQQPDAPDPPTRPLTAHAPVVTGPLVTGPAPGEPSAARSGGWRDRWHRTSTTTRAVAGVVAVLVLLLAVAALASRSGSGDTGDDVPDNIPAGVPTELRGPLGDLHDAIEGD